jgi:V/A-type H+-transporting ATPase subunit I
MNASGGIAVNLGISSILFGVFYGSVFGFENVIKPVFIRPMDNIIQILIYAVVFGVLLLVTGFIYSLINNIRKGDMENGLFGKDGVAGLTLYVLAIVFALTKYYNVTIFLGSFWAVIFTILILLIIMKEPAAKLIKNKRPLFSKSKPDYFIEESFGAVEAVLSMFTNTLSFIRVGAFALNHVGLFLAFSTLALMIRNNIGSIFIYIMGNIVIIGLEGLIVFIQGLRLEYYELFSKYYEANGIAFKPITLSDV